MIKLIKINTMQNASSSTLFATDYAELVANTINDNSDVFAADVASDNGGYKVLINISSENASIAKGYISSKNNGVINNNRGSLLAVDDKKDFMMLCPAVIRNTCGDATVDITGIDSRFEGTSNPDTAFSFLFAKDINGEHITRSCSGIKMYGGISLFLDIGINGTDMYTDSGDYVLVQGSSNNAIIPELFFSKTRLGTPGDIIESNGTQYICISGPIFYKYS